MFRAFFVTLTLLTGLCVPAVAEDRASMDEAKAMAMKGAEYLKANGLDKAATAFNDPGNKDFRDRDLYVFVFEKSGTSRVFPPAPKTVGRDATPLKDVDGKEFIKEFVSAGEPKWIDYKWKNAANNKVEQKSSYVIPMNVGGVDYVIGVGAYKGN